MALIVKKTAEGKTTLAKKKSAPVEPVDSKSLVLKAIKSMIDTLEEPEEKDDEKPVKQ